MQGSLNVVDIHLNDLLTGGPHLDGQIYSIVMLMRGLDLHQIEFAEILPANIIIGFGFWISRILEPVYLGFSNKYLETAVEVRTALIDHLHPLHGDLE